MMDISITRMYIMDEGDLLVLDLLANQVPIVLQNQDIHFVFFFRLGEFCKKIES